MRDLEEVRRHYDAALEAFVDRLRQDQTVVAAVLMGSLSHDVVWERSDIDLLIVRDDRKASTGGRLAVLTSHDVNVHCIVTTRNDFRRTLQGTSPFTQSLLAKSRILFTRDEALRQVFDEVQSLGEHERRMRLLDAVGGLVPSLDKTEKWLAVKQDAHYAAFWLLSCASRVATVVCLMHKELPGRETILQAQELDPELMADIYTGILDGATTLAAVGAAVRRIVDFLEEHLDDVFGPLLDYLAAEGGVRSINDIEQHFQRQFDVRWITSVCEWLAERGHIVKASAPFFLNQHSRVELDQLAFFIEGR